MAGENPVDTKIKALIAAITPFLTAEVQQTLPRIEELPLRVLALRRYLRIGSSATEKWAWTQKHYNDFNLSYAAVELRNSIRAVKSKFEGDNPDYTLGQAATFRPLDRQIHNFCSSAAVRSSAMLLGKAVVAEIKSYSDKIDPQTANKFRHFLQNYKFAHKDEPTIAVPGISDHGRAQAIDFIVYKDGKEVAGISKAQVVTVWKAQGFEEMLNRAVKTSANTFEQEHLLDPYEPWHYDLKKNKTPGEWSGELTFKTLA